MAEINNLNVASPSQVARRLILTREALGLSQTEICRRTGIKTNTWNQWENKPQRLTLDNAIVICTVFGVTLDWIYRGRLETLPYNLGEKIKQLSETEDATYLRTVS